MPVGIVGTCEHEVLPDHDSELVAEIVEFGVFVVSAAPDAEDVNICVGGGFEKFFVVGACL